MRLWGSSFNYQFEGYFPPELILFSFIPIIFASLAILRRRTDSRIFFLCFCYFFSFVAYFVCVNLDFLVFNLPFGALFQAPSIFLGPASLGLALLIGFSSDSFSTLWIRFKGKLSRRWFRRLFFAVVLIFVILAGFPWWNGHASGVPIHGPPTKLNLYELPSGYVDWPRFVKADDNYFVLYLPLGLNFLVVDSEYFSENYEGVNNGAFTQVNGLPYISQSNTSLLFNELMNGTLGLAERWGSLSIRYVVVYINVLSAYDMGDILYSLSVQDGLVEVANLPGVMVFENQLARAVVYSDCSDADVQIIYHDPALFKVKANSNVPFTLVFNQVYSSGWRAWVNGTALPESAHFIDSNGFNCWNITNSGTLSVDLYYDPQTVFLIGEIVSAVTIMAVVTYLAGSSVKKFRVSGMKN
jgi:hypothetical protein